MTNNILIAISAILNGIFLLYFSIIINLFLVWYASRVLKESATLQGYMVNMFETLNTFSDHLEKIHSMEMFYGEPVLRDLIDHSRNVINDIVDMQQEYYDDEEYPEEEEVLQDDTEENSPQEE